MHRTSKRCLYSSILLAAILLAAPTALAEPVPAAHWTFDKAKLVATGGVPGDGLGVNGVVADPQPGQTYSPAAVDAPGVHGRCYVFDGRRSVVGTTLRAIIPAAGDFSVTAWIRWDSLASSRGGHYILSNYVSGEPGRTGLEVRDGRLSFFADGTEINARADRVDDGAWHHVAVIRAGSDFSLWVDGVETPIGKSDLAIGTEREWLIGRRLEDEYGTCHIAGVSDLDDRDGKLTLKFSQFYPFPGGQQKFHIVYDTKSDLYWMVGNLVTDPQNHTDWFRHLKRRGYKGGAGNERRILTLFYGLDGLNWLQAGVVAMAKDPLQSFMYSHMFIDGDDLLFAVRTSKQGGNNHDAELITFHRVRGFRSLALDIHPRIQPEGSE